MKKLLDNFLVIVVVALAEVLIAGCGRWRL